MESALWIAFFAAGLVCFVLYCFHLLPYRNRWSVWYMSHYHPGYRKAKGIYDTLIEKAGECQASSATRREGYYKFLEYMRDRTDFRSSESLREKLEGKSKGDATVDDFDGGVATPDFESFCAFVGKGREYHKISVTFWFVEGIHLERIWLFYHEETGLLSFYFNLEEQTFPPDDPDDGGRRGRRLIVPPSVRSPQKKETVSV